MNNKFKASERVRTMSVKSMGNAYYGNGEVQPFYHAIHTPFRISAKYSKKEPVCIARMLIYICSSNSVQVLFWKERCEHIFWVKFYFLVKTFNKYGSKKHSSKSALYHLQKLGLEECYFALNSCEINCMPNFFFCRFLPRVHPVSSYQVEQFSESLLLCVWQRELEAQGADGIIVSGWLALLRSV